MNLETFLIFSILITCNISKCYIFDVDKDCLLFSNLSIVEPPKILIRSDPSEVNNRLPSKFILDVVNFDPKVVNFVSTYFDCQHSTPVQWIGDINPTREALRFARSFSQRIENGSMFSSSFEYLFRPRQLKRPTLLMCQSVCGSRSFLKLSEFAALIKPKDAPAMLDFVNLAEKLINSTTATFQKVNVNVCNMVLNVQVIYDQEQHHHLHYEWKTGDGITIEDQRLEYSKSTTDQGIYFRNVFRTVVQQRHCVKILRTEDSCSGCIKVAPTSTYVDDTPILNSVVFFARSNNGTEMAFKGVFSVTNPRRFYFDWELPLEEMVDFQPPPVVYAGHDVTVTCNVSTIYFAYGSLIYANNDSSTLIDVNASPINETWMPDGRRLVNKTMKFPNGNETISLTCSVPLWNWTMRVDKTVNIFVDYSASPEIEGGSSPEERIVEEGQENVMLTCSTIGRPRPRLQWVFPNTEISKSKWAQVLHFSAEDSTKLSSTINLEKISGQLLGAYLCFAKNTVGNSSKTFWLRYKQGLPTATIAGLSSGLGGVGVIGIITLALIYRKILVQRREHETKTQEAILEFKEGVKRGRLPKREEKRSCFVFFFGGVQNNAKNSDTIPGYHQSILELPYDDHFEVDLAKWEIEETLLGQGAFGYVRKGAVEVENKKTVVAIKMLKSAVDIDDFKSFLTELKIMAYIGKHSNVVSLIAACTQQIEQRDVMIGVEFCAHGSLKDYLKATRSMFQSQPLGAETCRTYANLSNSLALTEQDLFKWSYQIANGMEYLASKKVLHGDLAARNVLLVSDKTAKISDFGLSRLLLENKNYMKKSRVPLPWKWMAIESLKALNFSSASDVWAFGVTLFEIFTLGEVPYAGLSYGPAFISQLENGFRLAKPALATEYVYNIMKHCWSPEVESRLTFLQLKTAFSQLLEGFTATSPVEDGPKSISGSTPTPISRGQRIPVAQPRTRTRGHENQPQQHENWYSNRPIQIPNLYLNV